MAAAASVDSFVGPTAVRVKHVPRERLRVAPAGSFGSRKAEQERDREYEGRLSEAERLELLLCWSGNEASAGCRSNMGAVIDRLHRGPPRGGRSIEDVIERELARKGRQGMPRSKLVDILAMEDPKTRWSGATRHEIRQVLRGMRGRLESKRSPAAGKQRESTPAAVEYFVEDVARKNPVTDQDEVVSCEMVRLVERADRQIPEAVSPAERWRRQDAELEAFCRTLNCSESSSSGGSRLPPHLAGGRADGALRAMRRLPAGHRRVIEKAYGSKGSLRWGEEIWGSEEVARLAPSTPSVEAARRELIAERSTPATRSTVDRATFAADAMRAKLDAQPEGDLPRLRWRAERERFVEAVRAEAAEMLKEAVEAYRQAREG